jgi:hypothetical protein
MTAITARQQRKLQRTVHVLAGAAVLGYVYVPAMGAVRELIRFLLLPLLVATGVAMWQAPRLRRLWKPARTQPRRPIPRAEDISGFDTVERQAHHGPTASPNG